MTNHVHTHYTFCLLPTLDTYIVRLPTFVTQHTFCTCRVFHTFGLGLQLFCDLLPCSLPFYSIHHVPYFLRCSLPFTHFYLPGYSIFIVPACIPSLLVHCVVLPHVCTTALLHYRLPLLVLERVYLWITLPLGSMPRLPLAHLFPADCSTTGLLHIHTRLFRTYTAWWNWNAPHSTLYTYAEPRLPQRRLPHTRFIPGLWFHATFGLPPLLPSAFVTVLIPFYTLLPYYYLHYVLCDSAIYIHSDLYIYTLHYYYSFHSLFTLPPSTLHTLPCHYIDLFFRLHTHDCRNYTITCTYATLPVHSVPAIAMFCSYIYTFVLHYCSRRCWIVVILCIPCWVFATFSPCDIPLWTWVQCRFLPPLPLPTYMGAFHVPLLYHRLLPHHHSLRSVEHIHNSASSSIPCHGLACLPTRCTVRFLTVWLRYLPCVRLFHSCLPSRLPFPHIVPSTFVHILFSIPRCDYLYHIFLPCSVPSAFVPVLPSFCLFLRNVILVLPRSPTPFPVTCPSPHVVGRLSHPFPPHITLHIQLLYLTDYGADYSLDYTHDPWVYMIAICGYRCTFIPSVLCNSVYLWFCTFILLLHSRFAWCRSPLIWSHLPVRFLLSHTWVTFVSHPPMNSTLPVYLCCYPDLNSANVTRCHLQPLLVGMCSDISSVPFYLTLPSLILDLNIVFVVLPWWNYSTFDTYYITTWFPYHSAEHTLLYLYQILWHQFFF